MTFINFYDNIYITGNFLRVGEVMRLYDMPRYLSAPEDSAPVLGGEVRYDVAFAEGVKRLIQLYTEDDTNNAFGCPEGNSMGVISSKTGAILANGEPARDEDAKLLGRIAQTLMWFQRWQAALKHNEQFAGLGATHPTATLNFVPEVPASLPETNLQRALLAVSWALGRQNSVNPHQLDRRKRDKVAAALGLAVEIELTNGLPFEGALTSLLE